MKVNQTHNKGNHLLIDIYDCKRNLDSVKEIEEFISVAIKKIKMTAITSPRIIKYNSKDKEESGITGFVILAESHISIHTYPLKNFASIDIYSCNEFEFEVLIKYIQEFFGTDKIKYKLIKRPL